MAYYEFAPKTYLFTHFGPYSKGNDFLIMAGHSVGWYGFGSKQRTKLYAFVAPILNHKHIVMG